MLSTALDLPKCTKWRLKPFYLARKENVGLKIWKDLETSRIYQYFLKMESPLEVMGKEQMEEINMKDKDSRLAQG